MAVQSLIVVSLNVFSVVGLYRLFGSCRVIVAYYSEAFTKSTHPSTDCFYWLTDAYHLTNPLYTAYNYYIYGYDREVFLLFGGYNYSLSRTLS